MGFKQDAYAKVWKIENKGNYHVGQISTSKKNKQTDQYETDFNSNFVRFIGTAHSMAAKLSDGDRIKIGSCEVTNKYDKEKNTTYTNYMVYSFEVEGGKPQNNQSDQKVKDGFMNIPDGLDEELPFN